MGVIVVLIVGSLVIKFLKSDRGTIPTELLNQDNSIEQSVKTHTIVKDENLWLIAEKYYGDGFRWVDIATENKIVNASVIEVGQKLTISNVEVASTTLLDDQQILQESNTEAIIAATYEVVKGDSLWKIAIRAYGDGYKWVEIARENNIVNPNIIHTGNILVLPR